MPEAKRCPQCGTPLPNSALQGLCPSCLFKHGALADTVTEGRQPPFIPPPVAELMPLFPQLEILELVGKGGMGAVYKARQKQLERIVALKILPPGIGNDPAFAERFAREAKALAKLNHPGIVTIHDFGRADGLYYFLMEFVDGVNLRQLLNTSRISSREALAIVPQICDALQFAHDQGIVHRDIKPENVLLDRRGRVKVADFGLAKLVGVESETTLGGAVIGSPTLTDAGKVMGTPNYMAPEQREHPSEVDHRADIYAVGVVFYQMLTGELPGKFIEPPSRKVEIDVRLDEVVLRALEKEPDLRYQQASVLKTQVESIASSAAPEKKPGQIAPPGDGLPASLVTVQRSHFLPWLIGGVVLAVILICGPFFGYWLWSSNVAPKHPVAIGGVVLPVPSKIVVGNPNEPSFLPEAIRSLPEADPGNKRVSFMRLDNGVVMTLRRQTGSPEFQPEEFTWMRNKEVDVRPWFGTQSQHIQQAGLEAVDMLVRKISPAFPAVTGPGSWLELTPAMVLDALREEEKTWPYPSPLKTLTMRDDTAQSVAWAFRTRSGHTGVLQILGFNENPNSVTMRYKLLQLPATNQVPQVPRMVFYPNPPVVSAGENFGPLFERVISETEASEQHLVCFDFETGKRFRPPFPLLLRPNQGPAFVELSPELMQWVKSNHSDVLIQFTSTGWNVMNLQMQEDFVAQPTAWDSVTADRVAAVFAAKDAAGLVRAEVPASSSGHAFDDQRDSAKAFRTRSNTMGVMQWSGLNTVPRSVKIRYRFVESSTRNPSEAGAVKPAPPAPRSN